MSTPCVPLAVLVLPPCAGKTTLSRSLGFLDLDAGTSSSLHLSHVFSSLVDGAAHGFLPFSLVDEMRVSYIRSVLNVDAADSEEEKRMLRVAVVITHSPAVAFALNAKQVFVICPTEDFHAAMIALRGECNEAMAKAGRAHIMAQCERDPALPFFEYDSFATLNETVQEILSRIPFQKMRPDYRDRLLLRTAKKWDSMIRGRNQCERFMATLPDSQMDNYRDGLPYEIVPRGMNSAGI